MWVFLSYFALSFIAATLLTSGAAHMLHPGRFRQLIHDQGVVSVVPAAAIAFIVTCLELIGGALAVLSFRAADDAPLRVQALLLAGGLGACFWLYMRRLLREPARVSSCGCSPLSAPLTPASLTPSIGLVLAAVCGLAAMAGYSSDDTAVVAVALPCLWGVTFAGINLLYPASVLQLHVRRLHD